METFIWAIYLFGTEIPPLSSAKSIGNMYQSCPLLCKSNGRLSLAPLKIKKFGMVKPELPPNFDEMDPDEKTFAIAERNQALLSKCYEGTLVKHHLESYLALTRADSAIRRLFSSTDTTWKDGIVPLCDSLIQISEEWHQVGISEPCPYQIADGDLLKHRLELSQCRDWHELKAYTHELLQSDDDGWVPPQLDFDKVQLRHDELLQLYIQKESEELPEEEAKRLWFYTDRT